MCNQLSTQPPLTIALIRKQTLNKTEQYQITTIRVKYNNIKQSYISFIRLILHLSFVQRNCLSYIVKNYSKYWYNLVSQRAKYFTKKIPPSFYITNTLLTSYVLFIQQSNITLRQFIFLPRIFGTKVIFSSPNKIATLVMGFYSVPSSLPTK